MDAVRRSISPKAASGSGTLGFFVCGQTTSQLLGKWNKEGVGAAFDFNPYDIVQIDIYDGCDVSFVIFMPDALMGDVPTDPGAYLSLSPIADSARTMDLWAVDLSGVDLSQDVPLGDSSGMPTYWDTAWDIVKLPVYAVKLLVHAALGYDPKDFKELYEDGTTIVKKYNENEEVGIRTTKGVEGYELGKDADVYPYSPDSANPNGTP